MHTGNGPDLVTVGRLVAPPSADACCSERVSREIRGFVANPRHRIVALLLQLEQRRPSYPTPPGTARAPAPSGPPPTAAGPRAAPRTTRPIAAPGHLEHRPDEHTVHVAHERVGLDPELEQLSVGAAPAPVRREHVPREADVVGVGRRERGEVVRPDERASTRPQRLDVDARAASAAPAPAAARSAPAARAPGTCTRARSRHAARRTRQRPASTTAPPRHRAGARSAPRPGALSLIARDLPERVHSRVGAPRNRRAARRHRRSTTHSASSTDALNRPLPRLPRPSREPAPRRTPAEPARDVHHRPASGRAL